MWKPVSPGRMVFQAIDIQLDNAADKHSVSGDVQLPLEFGRTLRFGLKVEGEGIDPDQWDWQAEADGTGLQLPRLMRYWKQYSDRIGRGDADLGALVRMKHGVLQKLTLDVNAEDLVPAPAAPGAFQAGAFQSVIGNVDWSRSDTGWKLVGRGLQLARGTQVWPKIHSHPGAERGW